MELADLDLNKVYTYADYYKWKFEERVELIKGRIFKMSPAPNRLHQEVTGKMYVRLSNFLEKKPCHVYIAPFDVRLPRKTKEDKEIYTVLQPDICVICNPAILDERGCLGAPDLIVEILSPGNSKKEVKNKYEVYEDAGVKEYWIVDPIRQTLQSYLLADGRFTAQRTLTNEDTIKSAVVSGFSLHLEELFQQL